MKQYNKGLEASLKFKQIWPYIDINIFIDRYKKRNDININNEFNKGFINGLKQSKF